MDPFERLACYYGSMQAEGMTINWETGDILAPQPRTLRQPT